MKDTTAKGTPCDCGPPHNLCASVSLGHGVSRQSTAFSTLGTRGLQSDAASGNIQVLRMTTSRSLQSSGPRWPAPSGLSGHKKDTSDSLSMKCGSITPTREGHPVTGIDAFAALEKREWADANVAKSYARDFTQASDMVVPHIVAAVAAEPGIEALDLCCGHGNVAAELARLGARVTGVDFSLAMLALARDAVPEARFVEGDAMRLDFGDAEFDAVTIGFGIPHVPDPPTVFKEARRVLRPGGKLAFSVWCGPEVDTALGYVFGAIEAHGHPDIVLPPGPGANHYADPALSFPELEAAGQRPPRRCWTSDIRGSGSPALEEWLFAAADPTGREKTGPARVGLGPDRRPEDRAVVRRIPGLRHRSAHWPTCRDRHRHPRRGAC